nr:halocin H4 precursor [Haloferax mediterranei ATCC 33500]
MSKDRDGRRTSRRGTLKKIGGFSLGALSFGAVGRTQAATGSSVTTADIAPPGPNGDPKSVQIDDKYTGAEMYGEGDFRVGLGTDLTMYPPVYRESLGNGSGGWEFDFTVCGSTACRFVDSNGDVKEDDKAKEMWWQEINFNDINQDLYSRNDSDWVGSTPADTQPEFDYTDFALARDGVTLALTALNPAMGSLALGATYFLSDMVNWIASQHEDDSSLKRKWDYDGLSGPLYADSSTYLLARDEMTSNSYESFTIDNIAVAFPEFPVRTKYYVTFTAPDDPSTQSISTLEEEGIYRVPATEVAAARPPGSRRSKSAADEMVYVADPKKFIEVEPVKNPSIPDRIYEEIEQKKKQRSRKQ